MNNGRRGFLKMMAAAPAAIPVAVERLTKAVSSVSSMPQGPGFGLAGMAQRGMPQPVSNSEWLKSELSELITRRKEAESGAAKAWELAPTQIAIADVGALRSISHVNALRMAAEKAGKIQASRELSWIDKRIADCKKKLGPLAVLLGD